MQLADVIKDRIVREGPVSFRDFMEMALYYPELGYYTSQKEKLGRAGDYYTTPCLTPLFGEMLAKQLEEMWRLLGEKPFTIVEYGAGTGLLCNAILDQLKKNEKIYHSLNYCIIEKSPVMRAKEKHLLHEKVSWHDSIAEIPFEIGCVLSNEVIDNFSVHQVVMDEELMEVFVNYENGFVENIQPARDELKAYLRELKVALPKGYRTEINLQAVDWIGEVADAIKKGFVITIDYGFPTDELYRDYRKEGTLLCYREHQVNSRPYQHIGEQDITAHINFSALRYWGQKNRLDCCGFTSQAYFLMSLGFARHLREKEELGAADTALPAQALLVHRLLMDMGSKFKVLIQQKGIGCHCLSGMRLTQRLN